MKSLLKYALPALAIALILPVSAAFSSSGVSGRGEAETEVEHGIVVEKKAEAEKFEFELRHNDANEVREADDDNNNSNRGQGSGTLLASATSSNRGSGSEGDDDRNVAAVKKEAALKIEAETVGASTLVKITAKVEKPATDIKEVRHALMTLLSPDKATIDKLLIVKGVENELQNKLEAKAEVKDGMGKGEIELRFPVNSTDRGMIINAIFEKLASLMMHA